MELSLANVINISVSEAQAGVGRYNPSNLALFTAEQYNPSSFGDDGYKIYLEPTEVGDDFGTDSDTYAMALAVFSQQPNILAGGGYLVVIPTTPETQTITPSAAPASGTYKLNFAGDVTAAINWDDTATEIQTAIRTLTGLEKAVVTGTLATLITVKMWGYLGDAAMMTVTDNTLNGGITLTVAQTVEGETLGEAITRTEDLVQYFGIMASATVEQLGNTDLLAAALVVQAMNSKMAFFVATDEAAVDPGGDLDDLRSNNYTKSRGLFYGDGADDTQLALVMMAAYAGRGLSVDFTGSNTTSTMHLKDLTGVDADSTMDQTLLELCIDAGADTYISLQGVSKVFCSGENSFFDQVYNLQAFIGDLLVAGFNFLAQTSTKIPQTEAGMTAFKGAYRAICEQYRNNQYIAPGSWTGATTFGVQNDFLRNISEVGYYIYSAPISQQSQADREDRIAPLVQIAVKEAGAIQKANVIVYVNA